MQTFNIKFVLTKRVTNKQLSTIYVLQKMIIPKTVKVTCFVLCLNVISLALYLTFNPCNLPKRKYSHHLRWVAILNIKMFMTYNIKYIPNFFFFRDKSFYTTQVKTTCQHFIYMSEEQNSYCLSSNVKVILYIPLRKLLLL